VSANRLAVVVLSLFTALLLQVTVLARLSFLGAKPDLVLVAVICFALSDGPGAGMGAGFGIGLYMDLLGTHPLGLLALVLCVVGYAGGVIRFYFDRLSTFTPMLVVGALTAVAVLARAGLGALLGDPRVTAEPVVRSLLLTSLYDVLLTPFVFAAVTALRGRGDERLERGTR
jgi:rod shape-determining protein MreD